MLGIHREKWREVPGGDDTDERRFSSDLLSLADADLLDLWQAQATSRANGVIGWIGPLYRDFFKGRRVLELGSGMGLDGMRFASQGADWTFADIAADNLEVLRRVAGLKGVKAAFHLIGDDLSFDRLGRFDAVLACGSLHHVPFDVARIECASALTHLQPGGRWIELVYPRERWLKAGSPSFDQWGKMTDGDRTPWAEWYDGDKLCRRLAPARFRTILDFNFADDHYKWLDLEATDGQ
jgi:SAM-dependent methyltransferase